MENPLSQLKMINCSDEDDSDYTNDIETLLSYISYNSSLMSEHHKSTYHDITSKLTYYKIPIIVISACNSVISVGLGAFVDSSIVSVITCLLSLTVGIIGSISMYFNYEKRLDSEINAYKNFYILALKINSMLKLSRKNRTIPSHDFLTTNLNEYESLFSSSSVNGLKTLDKLVNINEIELNIVLNKSN